MAEFFDTDELRGSRFERVDLTGSDFHVVDLANTRFRDVEMDGVVIRGADLVDVEISGEIGKLVVNGVDVGPYVEAELDRRYPDRPKMRPTDPAGFREAWDILERLWNGTVERAARLDPSLLHESVDDEWSFTETLRHLVFATDAWIRRAILGDPSPWHPLGLAWDGLTDGPATPSDREAQPSLKTVLELRRDRMATVRELIEGLTDEQLNSDTKPVDAPGWPPPQSYPVSTCLSIILNEEWEHRLYAERDLAILELRTA